MSTRLRFTILLRRGVSRRAKGNSILNLSWLEMASDSEVYQVEMPIVRAHDISRLEIAEDNGWLSGVQIVKYRAELDANIQDFLDR